MTEGYGQPRAWRSGMRWIVAGLVLGVSSVAAAHEPVDAKNRVTFQVEASSEVSNDWVSATVSVSDEDRDAAALAARINEAMAWALEQARDAQGVKLRSSGYQTYPVYDKDKLRRWRGSQQLIIEGPEMDAVSDLIGKLQSRLQLQGIAFSVSPELRNRTQESLISDALAAYQARAELIRQSLGARGYETVRVDINTSGGQPRPMMHRAAYDGVARMEAAAKPALEAGTSRVIVQVNATIELE